MRRKVHHVSSLRFRVQLLSSLTAIIAVFVYQCASLAQSTPKKRPQLKDFGSSLKRLKWDPVNKRTVEEKRSLQDSTELKDGDVVRIETNLVTCDILVVDRQGNLVENLTAGDFVITEDGQSQTVGHFRLGDNASIPRSIVLIIDYSVSQLLVLRRSIDAAKLMVDKLAPLDLMAIVTDDVELLLDFTNDKERLKEKLESLAKRAGADLIPGAHRKFGRSAQYSALMATLNEAFSEEDLRPIIVFQTDGDEIFSLRDAIPTAAAVPPDLPDDLKAKLSQDREKAIQLQSEPLLEFSLADVYRAAEKSRATIYTVIPGFRLVNKTEEEQLAIQKKYVENSTAQLTARLSAKSREQFKTQQNRYRPFSTANLMFAARQSALIQSALAAVAPRTGGWTEFLETPEQADGIYNRILADINHRYIIGYYPTNKTRDGARRKIKFEVKDHPEYYVLGRTSYYAPSTP